MQELQNLHRNYSSWAIIWGSVHPTEENILLLKNIDMYNYTALVRDLSPLTPRLSPRLLQFGVLQIFWQASSSIYIGKPYLVLLCDKEKKEKNLSGPNFEKMHLR